MLHAKSGGAEVFVQFHLVLFDLVFINVQALNPVRWVRHTGTTPEAVADFNYSIRVPEHGRLGTKCCWIVEVVVVVRSADVAASYKLDDCKRIECLGVGCLRSSCQEVDPTSIVPQAIELDLILQS